VDKIIELLSIELFQILVSRATFSKSLLFFVVPCHLFVFVQSFYAYKDLIQKVAVLNCWLHHFSFLSLLQNRLNYSRILTASHLRSIEGQTHRWSHKRCRVIYLFIYLFIYYLFLWGGSFNCYIKQVYSLFPCVCSVIDHGNINDTLSATFILFLPRFDVIYDIRPGSH